MSFEAEYKKARNTIRSADIETLLIRIVMLLRKHELAPYEDLGKGNPLPWLMLDIFKMGVLYAGTNQDLRKVDDQFFAKIYNQVYDLNGIYQHALLTQDGKETYFTAVAFKQFWYQQSLYKGDFARANYLFRNSKSHYREKFYEIYGFGLDEYVEMIVSIWIHLNENQDLIYYNYKELLIQFGHEERTVIRFLNIISRTKEELKEELIKQDKAIGHPLLKFGEHTPLFRYPILKNSDDSYMAYNKVLLQRALDLNLFEFVKSQCGEEGIQEFATNFENYSNELIRNSGANYIREEEIKAKYGGKQTDFLVEEGELSIMIEAKSVRMSDITRANPTKKTIVNDLKDNVIKAIFQGMELSNKLQEEDNSREFALIVVAYDDLHLGTPETAYNYYLKEYCEQQFEEGNFEKGPLPTDAIFLVSIREFEKICIYSKQLGGFSTIIQAALKDNLKPETKKFTLSMSCPKDIPIDEGLCTIDQNFYDLWEDITIRIKQ